MALKAGYDKATADAATYKATLDKVTTDNFAQKAQVSGALLCAELGWTALPRPSLTSLCLGAL